MSAKNVDVDEVAKNVNLLAGFLHVKGYSMVTVESGPRALERFAAAKPDLVLLDS
jgi:CheY-like chemotaxis protein